MNASISYSLLPYSGQDPQEKNRRRRRRRGRRQREKKIDGKRGKRNGEKSSIDGKKCAIQR